MTKPVTTPMERFLLAASSHSAAMYELGRAEGMGACIGSAEHRLEKATAELITARKELENVK